MPLIYTPKGKAREYSPRALNIYLGCSHRCNYCYAPKCRHQKGEDYFINPYPRKDIAEKLEKELSKCDVPTEQVMLSFIGDCYCESTDNNQATRDCLEILLKYKVPVSILTKGGKRCLKDLELFKKFDKHIQVGATLTFDNNKDSIAWEAGASLPNERIETLKILHDNGIKTFASFEPVISPNQSINLIKSTLDYVDIYKIGKLNNYKGLDSTINWAAFLQESLDILRKEKKQIYVKHDLRIAAKGVRLYGNECLPDEHNIH